jgi:hypothetical protein
MSEMRDKRDIRNDEMADRATERPVDRPAERPMERPVDRQAERAAERPVERPRTTTEPVRTDTDTVSRTRAAEDKRAITPHQTELWPDMAEFRQRFDQIQAEFIEDPKSAVKNAEQLMKEAVERITRSMRDQMQSLHRDVDGKDGDTEMLRQTMRSYRMWIETMESRRAA